MSIQYGSRFIRYVNNNINRNIGRLFLGSSIAQIVAIAISPVLTRLYMPADLGLLAALMSATTILAPIITLKFEMALTLTTSREEAGAIAAMAAATVIVMSVGSALVAVCIPPGWSTSLGPLAAYWWAVSVSLFNNGLYTIAVYEATRVGSYDEIAKSRVTQAVAGAVATITMGMLGMHGDGVLFGFLFGSALGTILLTRSLLWGGQSSLGGITFVGMRAVAVKFRNFAQYSSWSEIVDLAGGQLVNVIVLSAIFGPEIGGYIFLADRVIGRPLLLFSTSILQVYVGEIGSLFNTNRPAILWRFLKASGIQMAVSAAWLLTIVLLAPVIVVPLFGKEWLGTVAYLQVMAVGYFPASVVHSVTHTLTIIGRQRVYAVLSVMRVVVLLAVYAYCVKSGLSPIKAVVMVTAAQGGGDLLRYGVTLHYLLHLRRR